MEESIKYIENQRKLLMDSVRELNDGPRLDNIAATVSQGLDTADDIFGELLDLFEAVDARLKALEAKGGA